MKIANEIDTFYRVWEQINKQNNMKNETKTKKKEVRKRVNIKDLAELPARLDLVSSNMTLVALLAKKDAENKKVFTDAQNQIAKLKATNQALVLEEARGAMELDEMQVRYSLIDKVNLDLVIELEEMQDKGVEAVKAAMSLYEDAKNKAERAEQGWNECIEALGKLSKECTAIEKERDELRNELSVVMEAGEIASAAWQATTLEIEEVAKERDASRHEVKCLKADHLAMGKTCASIRRHFQSRERDAKYELDNAHAKIIEYEQNARDWHRMFLAIGIVAVLIVCAGVLFS